MNRLRSSCCQRFEHHVGSRGVKCHLEHIVVMSHLESVSAKEALIIMSVRKGFDAKIYPLMRSVHQIVRWPVVTAVEWDSLLDRTAEFLSLVRLGCWTQMQNTKTKHLQLFAMQSVGKVPNKSKKESG